jgi:hypothetical protein
MTPDEFRVLMQNQGDAQLLDPCLQDEAPPYVFDANPGDWNVFRDELAGKLGVMRVDIRIVGSARFGFSMKPGAKLKSFSDKSDIDLVVVSPAMFDALWFLILEGAYPRSPVTETMGGWLEKRRNEVYTGWLTPTKIKLDSRIFAKAKPVLEFSARWFNAMKLAARHPSRRHEDIGVRLYRTWRHAQLYHLDSIAELRKSLAE